MLFKTREERAAYLARIEANPGDVALGSAMAHAAGVRGIWVEEDALASDCAKILAVELVRYARDQKHPLPPGFPSPRMLTTRSRAFRAAFEAARFVPRAFVEDILADHANPVEPQPRKLSEEQAEALLDLHAKIVVEFGDCGVCELGRYVAVKRLNQGVM